MITVAFDTETNLIRPGVCAPELACVQSQLLDPVGTHHARLHTATDGLRMMGALILDPNVRIVGHNVSYDLGVLCAADPDLFPYVFKAIDDGRVSDTMIRSQLIDIAQGTYDGQYSDATGERWIEHAYDLDSTARRYARMGLTKDAMARLPDATGWFPFKLPQFRKGKEIMVEVVRPDGFGLVRLTYGFMSRLPLDQWTPEHTNYALEDAVATMAVWRNQAAAAGCEMIPNEVEQVRTQWFLHLRSAWGLRTNAAAVEALRLATEEDRIEVTGRLVAAGLVREDGSRDTKVATARIVQGWAAKGLPPRRNKPTETMQKKGQTEGGICLDGDACKASGDPLMADYAMYGTLGTILSKDITALRRGVTTPVQCRFRMLETTRQGASNPNVQNWKG